MLKRQNHIFRPASLLPGLAVLACLAAPGRLVWADAYLQADILGLSTNAVATGFNLPDVTPKNGLYLIPYYLRIKFPANNYTAWGIQLYTNNAPTRAWAPTNGVYGGLRGASNPRVGIPMYWQVYDTPPNAAATWGTPFSVTMTAGELAFYDDTQRGHTLNFWGTVKDRNDIDTVSTWMTAPALRNRLLVGYDGLGVYPQPYRPYRQPPAYLYLGVDARQITQTDHFQTVLNLDLYNLGVGLNSGGYATPNPFTPATGQRTNFNFFLEDVNATFRIRIYTLRGRCIRTINDTREWDGRNDGGQLVEGGLYIYQIEAEKVRVSGTVVLIK